MKTSALNLSSCSKSRLTTPRCRFKPAPRYIMTTVSIVKKTSSFLAAALLCVGTASAAVLASDSFDGPAGKTLHGSPIEHRDSATRLLSSAWTANPHLVFSSSGDFVTTAINKGGELKFTAPDKKEGMLTLKADVKVQSADWIGLSLLSSVEVNVFDPRNTLLVLLNSTGFVQVLKNGSKVMLYSSSPALAGWNPQKFYTLELRYDRSAGTVDVLVDNVRLNAKPILVGELNSNTFSAVGVRLHGESIKANTPAIDNFSYSVR
jgi:hypothetical protein